MKNIFSIALVLVFAVLFVASNTTAAEFGQGDSNVIYQIENVENINYTDNTGVQQPEAFGAVAFQEGICSTTDLPAQMCNTNIFELSVENDLDIGDNFTASSSITLSNGYFDQSISIASATTEALGLELNYSCTGTDTNGCEDGTYNLIRFIGENNGGEDASSVATTTGEIRMVFDDTASSSQETSMQFYQILDNGAEVSNVFELDSGNAFFAQADAFGIGTTTTDYTLAVDTQSGTTSVLFGSPSSSACLTFYAGSDQTVYYLDPTATEVDDIATTTQPSWCN